MVYLSNNIISAEISETGAEITSLKKDGYEYIWARDMRIWKRSAPILFPIVCRLKDGKYILGGETYEMTMHGFLRGSEFTVESADEVSATFLYTHNAETLKMYPFKFEFRAVFTLKESSLEIEYRVKNINDRKMYFSLGSHESYAIPEGVEDYDIIFPCKENLETELLAGGLLANKTMTIGKNTEYLPLYEKYFMLDTLVFKNLKSREVILKNRKKDISVKVEFPDCDYLGVWHKQSAGFVCIEPWSGLPDNIYTTGDITEKEGIITLDAGCEYKSVHRITV